MAKVLVAENSDKFLKHLKDLVQESANSALTEKNKFLLGVSGGSCVKYLVSALKNIKSDFSKWIFFFCDERIVPEESNDSTYGAYIKAIKEANINISESQFVPIKQGLTANETAEDYRHKLEQHFPGQQPPVFDLLLLGMGPDGHTCSLFPNHPILNETKIVAPITDSPKPPSERITLTLPVINSAKQIIFAIAGEEKAPTIERILIKKDQSLPAAQIDGNVCWILDAKAAQLLPKSFSFS